MLVNRLRNYKKILLFSVIVIIFFNLFFALIEVFIEANSNWNLQTIYYYLVFEIISGIVITMLSIIQTRKMNLKLKDLFRLKINNKLLYLIPICIFMGYGLKLLGSSLNELSSKFLPTINLYEDIFKLIHQNNTYPEKLLSFITFALIPGITEEVFFRGFVYSLIRRYNKISIGIIVTTIIFLLFHPIPSIWITYALINIILCLSLEYSENLLLPIVIHISLNSFALFI